MIYLDYSATTPVNMDVLETFNKVCGEYIGNANSLHKLGVNSNELLERATMQIVDLLALKSSDIIYTSGATESNNLAIKGVCSFYKKRGNHIITTRIEHSSVKETINYLIKQGYEVSYVNLLNNGLIDIDHLKSLIKDTTVLVSISYVDSEVGLKQPVEDIGEILKDFPRTVFHVDATQAIGKIKINLDNIDLVSFSAHKFYGLKGIGCLIKKETIELEPILHGGKSTSKYRSGTPMLPLIVSLTRALRLSFDNLDEKYNHVLKLNKKIVDHLLKYDRVIINSNKNSIPHILNISLCDIKPETFVHALGEHKIYISTKSACSDVNLSSDTLLALHKPNDVASSSIRISLSYLTTEEEIDQFLHFFDLEYKALNFRTGE
jgi:cysteine desulfurase